MKTIQRASVNIVGPRRIGRSSLLYYFTQVWRDFVPQPERYLVAYLSLQEGRAQTENNFYHAAATHLIALSNLPEGLTAVWQETDCARTLCLSYLHEDEARDLIQHPTSDFPEIYSPEAVDQIIEWSRCQPFLVQLLCMLVVKKLNRDKRRHVEPNGVEAVLSEALETGNPYFCKLWQQRLNEKERRILTQLLEGKAVDDFLSLRQLVDIEIIERRGDVFAFQVPLVRLYVERKVCNPTHPVLENLI